MWAACFVSCNFFKMPAAFVFPTKQQRRKRTVCEEGAGLCSISINECNAAGKARRCIGMALQRMIARYFSVFRTFHLPVYSSLMTY